ncbi:hypothetical protein MPAR168_00755 [Methylorubrum populi]|uniref:Uncharacterized protein n=1 Tax=Methylobacterium radiotolerans TaxID=31998 RepID=A0ABU7T8E7_9HYPH
MVPAWERAYEAVLQEDCLALGDRLRPVDRTDERVRRGRIEDAYPRSHYAVPVGTVVVVAPASSRVPQRAYVGRDDGVAEVTFVEAGDLLDPTGANRRAWGRRIRATGLTEKPRRFRREPGHEFEADVVYGLYGQPHVALCTKAGTAYVWLRAVTYAKAQALGVA